MVKKTKLVCIGVLFALLFQLIAAPVTAAPSGIALFTPYTGISVTPGETIDYSFEIMNFTDEVQQLTIDVQGLPEGWDYEIVSGGWQVQNISVKPNESERFTMDLHVPLKVPKNSYSFRVVAKSAKNISDTLPLTVTVTEQGTYSSDLSTEQPNMQGSADATFEYDLKLRNRTSVEQHYSLTAEAPRGWDVNFKVDGNSVTAVTAESNTTRDIKVEITPPAEVKADTYKIPIKATTAETSAETTLEAVITGKYNMELSTPTGRLNEKITAGREKTIELEITNTGSTPLRDINLRANQPVDWEVNFEPSSIVKIEPGESEIVKATIKASKQAIAGDYVVSIDATTPEVSANAQFRMQVETSMVWGWIGVLIIIAVAAGIYYVIRKYGRR